MKYASIIVTHYTLYDDFGGKRAKERGSTITRSETIRKTIESIHKNTHYPYELIVIDNGGGGDDSDWLLQKSKEGWIHTYVRNKNNMHFAFGRNQGMHLATGDYVCICDNDMEVHENWLTTCIGLLEKYPDTKYIASPVCTPDKDNDKFWVEPVDGNRVNTFAGSSCFLMTREVMQDIGQFVHSVVGGTYWHRQMRDKGYKVILPPENMADHLGFAGGLDIYHPVEIKKVLSNDHEVHFDRQYGYRHIFKCEETQ